MPVGLLSAACATSAGMQLAPEVGGCPEREASSAFGTIAWYVPSGSGDKASNERWCRTVGPPVVRTVPSVSPPDPADGDSLAVIGWNILIGGGDVPRLLIQEAHRRSEAVPDVPESFRFPPRIVPASHPEGWPDIVELARRCGLALFYVPSQRNGPETVVGGREDKGNAILATLPLSDLLAIELPFEAGRKVAVGATISLAAGKRLRVVSVHLDVASTLYRTLTTANTARLRQAVGVVEALALSKSGEITSGMVPVGSGGVSCGVRPHTIATVLAGDFNTWSAGESTVDQLLACFPDSAPWDGQPTHGSYPTDFIFFRRAAEGRIWRLDGSEERVADSYGSDHHARIAWLEWSE
ncbi:MAG: hypothetical protein P8Y07_13150 [Gemmatimonadales bacterium]